MKDKLEEWWEAIAALLVLWWARSRFLVAGYRFLKAGNDSLQWLWGLVEGSVRRRAMESKAVNFVFEGSHLKVTVDSNKDGQPVMSLDIDLAEIPDEVMAAINAKRGS